MVKRVLMVAAKPNMIQKFNHRNIKILQDMGYEVHIATNMINFGSVSVEEVNRFKKWMANNQVITHQVDFERRFGTIKSNIQSIGQLNTLFRENKFHFVHVQSPLGSILGRLVAKKYKVPVMYTAHGFHFVKNGPKSSWFIFFPLEWLFSFITDTLVTINDEDFMLAKKTMHAKKIVKINGIGVNIEKSWHIKKEEKYVIRNKIRKELGIPEHAFLISSVGELNDNKNQKIVLEALKLMPFNQRKNVYYVIAGVGENTSMLTDLAKSFNFEGNFQLLGYRTDIHQINYASDLSVFPSFREGLGIAGLDAVIDGTYILGSDIRGIKDYVLNDAIGKLFNPFSPLSLLTALYEVMEHPVSYKKNAELLVFDDKQVDVNMESFYGSMTKQK